VLRESVGTAEEKKLKRFLLKETNYWGQKREHKYESFGRQTINKWKIRLQ